MVLVVRIQEKRPGFLGCLLRDFPTLARLGSSHQRSAVHPELQGWGFISKRGSIKDAKGFAHREVQRSVQES